MGVLWTVWPLDNELRAWLDRRNLSYPTMPSRLPTGGEIKEVLGSLTGYIVEIQDNGVGVPWRALVSQGASDRQWTQLNISTYSGDDVPQHLCFEKGWESLIKEIVRRLAAKCGPLALFADTGTDPEIITAPPIE